MTEGVINNLKPAVVFRYFEKISAIPRNSGKEKAISDYIYRWALSKGLSAIQDETNNVIIKKPASKGYEEAAPVLLQAHMDMVCEKLSSSSHNFETDPILFKVDGDMLTAAGGTTLGADNGIGVAYCLALLEGSELLHPPLEVLLTVEEESTFRGVNSVSPEHFMAKRLINLDHAVEGEVLAGSCGGQGVRVNLPVEILNSKEQCELMLSSTTLSLHVKGLPGGHSGEDIHRGFGSAIQLMLRILFESQRNYSASLSMFAGGTSRLAIAREARATVHLNKGQVSEYQGFLKQMEEVFRKEYEGVAPHLQVTVLEEEPTASEITILRQDSFRKLLNFLVLFPDGIQQMNGAIPGVVESSINMGIVELKKGSLNITAEMRYGLKSTGHNIENKIEAICHTFQASQEFFSEYAPWPYYAHSELRNKAMQVFESLYGYPMKATVVHAGIECGCLLERMPYLDAISIGPNCWNFHSPTERMSISSVERCWKFLTTLLETLRI